MYIFLNKTTSILDTSTAKPRRSFFLEEARPLFETIHHQFCSLADLERYWFQLQSICLQTPIILGEDLVPIPVCPVSQKSIAVFQSSPLMPSVYVLTFVHVHLAVLPGPLPAQCVCVGGGEWPQNKANVH